MKKKLMIPVALGTAFVAGMAVVPNSYADAEETCGTVTTATKLKGCLTTDSSHSATLAGDITTGLGESISISNDATLNLNGHNITSENDKIIFEVTGAKMTIQGNGTITSPVTSDSTVTQSKVVNFKGTTGKTATTQGVVVNSGIKLVAGYPLMVASGSQGAATLDVYGELEAKHTGAALYINGNVKDTTNYPTLHVHNGAKVSSPEGTGIYLAGYGKTIIDAATVSGQSGISVKAGSLTLNNATVTGTGPYNNPNDVSYNGSHITGAAIQIPRGKSVESGGYAGLIDITINGGTYTSEHGAAILEYTDSQGGNPDPIQNLDIEDGTFKSASGVDPIEGSDSFNEKNQEFIKGGKFLSGGKPADVPEEYIAKGLVEDPITGEVMTEIAYQELIESRKPHYPCKDFPTCWFASTEPNDTPSDPTEPSEPTNPSNPADPTNPGENNNGNANNGSTGSGSGDEGVVNPNTADSIAAYAGMVVVALLGLGATAAGMIKSRKAA